MLYRVLFRKENVTITVPEGANLRQAALDHGIDVYPLGGGKLSCHGKGFCGTCAVEVEPRDAVAWETPRGLVRKLGRRAAEGRTAKYAAGGRPNVVLSCQMAVKADAAVTTNPGLDVNWQSHTYYSGRRYRSWEKVS